MLIEKLFHGYEAWKDGEVAMGNTRIEAIINLLKYLERKNGTKDF